MKRRTQFFLKGNKVVADQIMTLRKSEVDELIADNARLLEAIKILMVPFNESVSQYNGGLPSGVYVQRFRFEQARAALGKEVRNEDQASHGPHQKRIKEAAH